jgi:hypothetical protein
MKISAIKAERPKIYLDLFYKYGPKKWLKSEALIKAPLPEIRQGIKLIKESKIG